MKIELNGTAVASFFVGVVLGAIGLGAALTLGPISRLQQERDHAIAVTNEQRTNIAQLQGFIAASQRNQQTIPQPVTPQSQDPAVQVLNAVHPGLGTVAAALNAAVQKSQAEKQAIAAQQTQNIASQPVASAVRKPVLFCPSGDCAACPDGYGLATDSETQKHVCALTGN